MINSILVPIDISENETGAVALKLAQDLARTYQSKILLLNVVETVPAYVAAQIPPSFHKKALADATERLNDFAIEHGVAENCEVVVREGHPSTEILEFAKETSADMIVIASHDPGLADYLLGSVAARVVRHAHCSVLVTRKLEI